MRPPSLRSSVSGFFLVAFICLASAYAVFVSEKREIEANAQRSLGDVAVLKVEQIVQWRTERLADGTAFGTHTAMAGIFDRWLARGAPDDVERRWMVERLETIRHSHEDFRSVLLLDRRGNVRLATRDPDDFSGSERRLALAAMAARESRLGDISVDAVRGVPVMGMAVPLLDAEGESAGVRGALYFRIDPARSVFAAMESWPVDSRTAETLLVRREGGEAVFLNRLRHSTAAPLSLRMPLDSPDLPAAMALRGETGVVGGRDYRGEPVVSYVLRVPGTDWALVAKVDEAELYAPIHVLAWYVLLGLLAMLSLAAFVFRNLLLRAELAYRGYCTELRNQELTQRLENVGKFANEAIILVDCEGRILEANERAAEVFGYSNADMLNMNVTDLRAPECRASAEVERERLKSRGSLVVETTYQRKDGSRFAAELSATLIEAGEGRESYGQGIIRDITERKRSESALRLHEQMTRKMQEGLMLVRAADGVIVFANPRMEGMFGYAPGELCGRNVSCLNAVTEESPGETAARILGERLSNLASGRARSRPSGRTAASSGARRLPRLSTIPTMARSG